VVPLWLPIVLVVVVGVAVVLIGLLRKESVQTLATDGSLAGASPSPSPSGSAGAKSGAGGAGGAGGGGAGAAGGAAAGAGAVAAASSGATTGAGAPLTATEAACLSGTPVDAGSSYAADGTAQDSGPDHQDATVQGATYGPGATGTGSDQAFVFAGGTSAVDLGAKVGQLGTSSFCVAMVVNTTQRVQQSLIGDRTSAAAGATSWDLRLQPSGTPYVELGSMTVNGYVPVNDGKWHRLCVIRSNTLVNLYVDGRLAGTTNASPVGNVSSGGDTHLGWDGSVPYAGSIDSIVIVQG
jgi:hypothetical protein